MKAYKGFDKNLQGNPCGTPFQYKIGKTYEEPEAVLCRRGFHACERPLDVLSHYAPATAGNYGAATAGTCGATTSRGSVSEGTRRPRRRACPLRRA